MTHLLNVDTLNFEQLQRLVERALLFKGKKAWPQHSKHRMAALFYENSTRTRISFELAAVNLSIPVIHFDSAGSSESKGEVFQDTFSNLVAMGLDLFVVRHRQEEFYKILLPLCPPGVHLINAGDGAHAHPSQALLDLMTLREHKPLLPDCKVAIVGNISHSRVAKSLQFLFQQIGLRDLVLVAPPLWQPSSVIFGKVTDSLEEGLDNADVVICLRIQKERFLNDDHLDLDTYIRQFRLTASRLLAAKKDVIVMHPGPLNRGLELDSEIADGKHSCILQQVTNGVFMRMAIIDWLLGS